ncbi:MAG TPA: AraC family transcriptional regulator [Thermoanaerobaculia bacterium]|jgi:AraC family transcriptional regulator
MRFSPAQFPAAVVRSRTMGEFVMTETRYGGDAALAPHSHEYACLVLVLAGAFRERYGARQRDGEPGMVIVRPAGELHSNHFAAGGGRCLNVELAPHWLARVRGCTPLFDDSAAFRGAPFALATRRLFDELSREDDVAPLAVESLILSLAADGARTTQGGAPPRWLARVKTRIDDEPTARLTLTSLAAEAGVHPVHLATTFRRHYGTTVAAYIRQCRIAYACRALAESDVPLADVALAAGFADQSHFGRHFKRSMSVTPAEYRLRFSQRA